MLGLHNFPFITSLCIVAQDIREIKGLENCPLIETLWICETLITRISGLDSLPKLKKLYLYSNRIERIENLNELNKLEVLSLNDNDIVVMENLDHLTSLQCLHIGNNRIKFIGNSLNNCTSLQELNLAGNRISSFREILHLSRLKTLSRLSLSDPNFSDNPICGLCNYQTYTVHHLPNLCTFDTMEVTQESRRLIGATIVKKRMYYNMRIITIRRNCDFLIKTLKESTKPQIQKMEEEIQTLWAKVKKIQRHIDTLLVIGGENQKEMVDRLTTIQKAMYPPIEQNTKAIQKILETQGQVSKQIIDQSNEAIRVLLLELETGGNVRFEDEQKEATWVSHCEKQIKRLIKRAASKDSPKTIQIHKISRLHNRGARIRFDECNPKNPSVDKLNYVCFQDPTLDMFAIVENGPESLPKYDKEGIPMTNYFECQDRSHSSQLRKTIIYRLGNGNCKEIQERDITPAEIQHRYPEADYISLPCDFTSDAKIVNEVPRKYIVFNPAQMLPEYFVEYSLESDFSKTYSQIDRLLLDIAFSNRLSHANMPLIVQELSSKIKKTMSDSMEANLIENLEREYPELRRIDDIAKSANEYFSQFQKATKSFSTILNLSGITHLVTDNLAISDSLTSLTITHANLTTLPNFSTCHSLELLDLSFNMITNMTDLSMVAPKLRTLDLCANKLHDVSSIECLQSLKSLEYLDIRFNPLAKLHGIRDLVLGSLRQLTSLNHEAISQKDKMMRGREFYEDWNIHFQRSTSNQTQSFRQLSMRTISGPESSALEYNYYPVKEESLLGYNFYPNQITTLELDNCELTNLDRLPTTMESLKWASFRNNYIQNITKLANYTNLEELSLEGNLIGRLEPLTSLPNLTKLDLANNRICTIENANFRNLMCLNLESNEIKSIRPLAKTTTLLELYLGDNLIHHSFSLFPLKELPRLIILDLSGNAVCKASNFRLFTIFHLNRLKILNGNGITSKDQAQAREAYMGKLTIELLGEKIGHFNFKNITELDLRNCKIREIDCLSGGDFRSLRKLNFDNNLLVNIDCFVSLVGLRHLSLNNNKIERLLSMDTQFGNTSDSPKSSMVSILPNLEELYLGYNCVSRVSDLGLHRMPQLKILYLQGNKISKVDGLEQMTNLYELVLDKNQIKTIDPMSFLSLINLRELHIKSFEIDIGKIDSKA
jgi:Leucine-rich repeat (LRR) protein